MERYIEVLKAIDDYIELKGYAPTLKEVIEVIGVTSTSSIHQQVVSLEKRGLIERQESSPSAMRITEKGTNVLEVFG